MLVIIRETQIVWCACLNHIPIKIEVADVVSKGMIVTVSEDGLLAVNYLGTAPPALGAGPGGGDGLVSTE